jgi:hypothetical protein
VLTYLNVTAYPVQRLDSSANITWRSVFSGYGIFFGKRDGCVQSYRNCMWHLRCHSTGITDFCYVKPSSMVYITDVSRNMLSSSAMIIEMACLYETSAKSYQTTQHHIPEDNFQRISTLARRHVTLFWLVIPTRSPYHHHHHHHHQHLWALQSMMKLGLCFYGFLIVQTVGRTPWAGDQPVTRPLPTQDNTNKE